MSLCPGGRLFQWKDNQYTDEGYVTNLASNDLMLCHPTQEVHQVFLKNSQPPS